MNNHTAKIKEVLKGIEKEMGERQDDSTTAAQKAFEAGYRAGLARAMTTIQILFHNDLKQEV